MKARAALEAWRTAPPKRCAVMPMGGWQSALPRASRPVPVPPPAMYALLELLQQNGLTKKEARRAVRDGKVVIDGEVVRDPDMTVVEGTEIHLSE